MKIQVTQDKGVDSDIALTKFVNAHVVEALKPFENRITNVDVEFTVVTSKTRSGDDKRCHMRVTGEGIDSIGADDDAPTMESAVRLATERMLFLLTSKFGSSSDRGGPANPAREVGQ